MKELDLQILNCIAEHMRCAILDAVMPVVSRLGNNGLIFILTGLALLPFRKTRRKGVFLLICLAAGAVVVNLILKPWIARERPYEALAGTVLLIARPDDFSFPSGHTAAAFETAFALSLFGWRAGIPAYAFAVLMGFSRLYLYVHYPSDVAAGALVGTLLPALILGGYRLLSRRRRRGRAPDPDSS